MQITCASCKNQYNLTMEQIQGLSYSIMPCKKCSKFIKITSCPRCRSYYSITFSSTQQSRYQLTCEKCSHSFIIEFPLIKEPIKESGTVEVNKKPPQNRKSFFKSLSDREKKKPAANGATHSEPRRVQQRAPSPQTAESFTLSNLLKICSGSLTLPNLFAAGIAIVIILALLAGYNLLLSALFESGNLVPGDYLKSFFNIVPFAIVLFIYIMAASFISWNIINGATARPAAGAARAAGFLFRSLVPVFLTNVIVFIGMDLIFILFGRIPVIGPVLFALLFLPIYLTSILLVLFLAIGFWFYPPIIATSESEPGFTLRRFALFIKKHNFTLIYTIPLLSVITILVFFTLYLVHYGSFSLSLFLSKIILSGDGEMIFSAVPSQFLQMSDLTLLGSDSGLFKSLIGNILVAHTIGGFIIGLVFSLISIFLFSCFISITATLSTHIYLMMERGADIDDSSKIRLLLLVVLILLVIFLVKKIIL